MNIVFGTVFHGFDGAVHVMECGNHNDVGIGKSLFKFRQTFQSGFSLAYEYRE